MMRKFHRERNETGADFLSAAPYFLKIRINK